ncbi:hypothetical protein [Neobacillus jeddahensis]|uniref:hypothetical protein n=1 Tax=Neobacillus jeddahensis TaxID=1461580 RepID=UPI00058B933D|nr:hypothetical protein [Neobacillus jeddahensis]
MKAFLTVENAKIEISNSEHYIKKLKEYINLVENYETDTFEKLVIKTYALLGNVAKVADKVNSEGFRFNQSRKYTSNDITAIIQSKDTIDNLHEIVRDIQKRNKTKASRKWS